MRKQIADFLANRAIPWAMNGLAQSVSEIKADRLKSYLRQERSNAAQELLNLMEEINQYLTELGYINGQDYTITQRVFSLHENLWAIVRSAAPEILSQVELLKAKIDGIDNAEPISNSPAYWQEYQYWLGQRQQYEQLKATNYH
jgi:hypothetical protein